MARSKIEVGPHLARSVDPMLESHLVLAAGHLKDGTAADGPDLKLAMLGYSKGHLDDPLAM